MSRTKRKQLPRNGNQLRPRALNLDLALLDQSLAQDALAEFVRQTWNIIEPSTQLLWNWHLDAICVQGIFAVMLSQLRIGPDSAFPLGARDAELAEPVTNRCTPTLLERVEFEPAERSEFVREASSP